MSNETDIKELVEIFKAFFKIGCFTFGGGYAMIPIIEREVIINKEWMKEEDIIDIFAVSESLPGAIAINSSTFIGYKIAGRKGAFAAMLGVILPSFIIITLIAAFFARFQENAIIKAAFLGIRSAVVGLILLAALKIGKTAIRDKIALLIMVFTIFLIIVVNIHAVFVIMGGAAIGLLIYSIFPGTAKNIIDRYGEH
ncbi:MAG TPA: chromate transporter [Clostridia bacterium]|nr:chromate transporter [Clostridia bacterium]